MDVTVCGAFDEYRTAAVSGHKCLTFTVTVVTERHSGAPYNVAITGPASFEGEAEIANGKEGSAMSKRKDKHDDHDLRGTFASVMLLGAFLVITWVAVFFLFIARS